MRKLALLIALLFSVAYGEEIETIKRGDYTLLVNAVVNSKALGVLMVDTGASYVVLSPALAAKLGLVSKERLPIQTGGRIVDAQAVNLDSIQVGSIVLHDIPAIIQPVAEDDPVLAGVIGMSALSRLNIRIEGSRLYMSPR